MMMDLLFVLFIAYFLQSQLDIPFKVRAGHIGEIEVTVHIWHLSLVQRQISNIVFLLIGRLELKIPWKNLYTQSVEATLDGVYLLIVPTASKNNVYILINAKEITEI